jgi:uncharacterized SAM-binding protein YcdF (DUF218 family)
MTDFSQPVVKLAVGHGFDIEKAEGADRTTSGFRPAKLHDKTKLPLMGDLRLFGFVAALQMNYCEKLLLAARDEERYPDENINQAWAISEMMVKDYGVDPERVLWIKSGKGTAKNILAMKQKAAELGAADFAVITNKYHLERSLRTFSSLGAIPHFVSAESLWLAASPTEDDRLSRYSFIWERWEEDLLLREVAELEGLAKDLLGQYKSSY